jgi:tungstate transport system ATP-binding protein
VNLYQLDSLVRSVNGQTILEIDHLTIEEGTIYGLVGSNGAGKTTLLDIMAFLSYPTSGKAIFQGRVVHFHERSLQRLRQQVVLLDQYPILFSTTVYKNLEFGLKIRNVPRTERMRRIDQALDLVDMRSFKGASAKTLSGGEVQRVALARALALDPLVFLCDEPTASVDLENQTTIVALLKRINREKGTTVIFTTHDRQLAANLSHHVVVLNLGRITRRGYDNVFSCKIQMDSPQKRMVCKVNGNFILTLPASMASVSEGRHQLWIDPDSVRLVVPAIPSREYRFTGQLTQLGLEGEKVSLTVDIGFPLVIFLSVVEYKAQRPTVGETVEITFDSKGILIR